VWIAEQGSARIARLQPHTPSPFEELDLPDGTYAYGIAAGPDGNMWFTGLGSNQLGKVTPEGGVTMYDIPTPDSSPASIAPGPDGNMWFTESDGNKVAKITPAGVITEYPLPTPDSELDVIVAGPDGRMWFTENGASKIGSITTDGSGLVEYDTPSPGSGPAGITTGPDGRLWFSEMSANKIGASTTSGTITEYPVPTLSSSFAPHPDGVAPDAHGQIWYAGFGDDTLGRLSTAGTLTKFAGGPMAHRLALGADGQMWVDYFVAGRIGTAAPDGTETDYVYAQGVQGDIAAGPDGTMWFTWRGGDPTKIVRLGVPPTLDGQIAKTRTSSYKGQHVYNTTGIGQTVKRTLGGGSRSVDFFYRAGNRGPGTGAYMLRGSTSPACFKVRYFIGGADVTDEVTSGMGAARIAVGDLVRARINVKAKACALPGDEALVSLDIQPTLGVGLDRVRAKVTV